MRRIIPEHKLCRYIRRSGRTDKRIGERIANLLRSFGKKHTYRKAGVFICRTFWHFGIQLYAELTDITAYKEHCGFGRLLIWRQIAKGVFKPDILIQHTEHIMNTDRMHFI